MSEPASIANSGHDRRLDQACTELEQAVRERRGRAEDWISQLPELAADPQAVVGLVYREFSVRWALGESPAPEEYYQRFPAIRRALEEQIQIHEFLAEVCAASAETPGAPARVGLYEIESEIGRGATGVVYRARHTVLDRIVALKVLSPSVLSENESDRFLTEARAVARLQHPNIVQLFEVGECGGRPFLALEYVPGGNLAKAIAAETISPRAAAELVTLIARALAYSHDQGILHRDLKPSNILLASQGAPKIADFGLSKLIDRADGATRTGAVLGTPEYMAPEQAVAVATVGVAADVYGLGAILYELLTGRPPFRAETQAKTLYQVVWHETVPVTRLQPDVELDLATVCEKCLAKDPTLRYASASDLADDLDRFLAGRPIMARPPSTFVRIKKWSARHPLHVLLAGVLVLAVGGLVAMALWSNVRLRLAADEANRHREAAEESAAVAQARLETARELNYSRQLAQVNDLWQSDPVHAMQLLEDRSICPVEMRDFTWGLFHHLCRSDRILATGTSGGISALALAADGNSLAVSSPSAAQRWDLVSYRLLSSIQGSANLAIAFGPEGRLLTAGTRGPIVVLGGWTDEGSSLDLVGHKIKPARGSFSGDGRLLATNGSDQQVCLWILGQTQPVSTLSFTQRVQDVALSADGRTLLVALADATQEAFNLIRPEAPKLLFSAKLADVKPASALALSRDGSLGAIAVARQRSVVLFDPRNGARQMVLWGHTDRIESLDFSHDGRMLVSGSLDHSVRVWDAASGAPLAKLASPGQRVHVVRIAADGQKIFASGDRNELQIWGLAERLEQEPTDLSAEASPRLTAIGCSPDGSLLTVGAGDGRIELRDPATLAVRDSFQVHKSGIFVIAWSPDNRQLATGGEDGQVCVTDLQSRRVTVLDENRAGVRSVAFSSDGARIAAGCDGEVRLWDSKSLQEIDKIPSKGSSVDAVVFSPDGQWLAVGYQDARLHILHATSLVLKTTLDGHRDRVLIARFSPDSRSLVTGGIDRTVRLWNVADFTLRSAFQWREGYPYSADFAPDGRTLAIGGGNRSEPHIEGEVVLCDVATGHLRATLSSQAGPVTFLPDGRTLITISDGSRIKRWVADPPEASEVAP